MQYFCIKFSHPDVLWETTLSGSFFEVNCTVIRLAFVNNNEPLTVAIVGKRLAQTPPKRICHDCHVKIILPETHWLWTAFWFTVSVRFRWFATFSICYEFRSGNSSIRMKFACNFFIWCQFFSWYHKKQRQVNYMIHVFKKIRVRL